MPRNPYEKAAAKYRPMKTRMLFVAEAPPSRRDCYFYFEKVKHGDWLWIALMKAVFPGEKWGPAECERRRKPEWLSKFQKNGCWLIDALKRPIKRDTRAAKVKSDIKARSRELISEVKRINPECIVLIKVTVYDALFNEFTSAGLRVMDARLPFPSSGRQKEFHRKFPRKC